MNFAFRKFYCVKQKNQLLQDGNKHFSETPRFLRLINIYTNILDFCTPLFSKSSLKSYRSSHQRCSLKKLFLKICNVYRKTPMFLIKLQAFWPAALFLKMLQHRYFPVNIAKFLRTAFLKNICEQLLLKSE